MARDDDDDDDRPRKKNARAVDEDEDDEAERPRKKKVRTEEVAEEEEEVEEKPRKKNSRAEEVEVESAGSTRPMPVRLVGAIIASMAWGILVLHGSCLEASTSIMNVIQIHRAQEQMRGFGFNPNAVIEGRGMLYTMAAAQLLMFLLGGALLAGGAVLLVRKGMGKYPAMGAPFAMVLVQLGLFVAGLIFTGGVLLAHHNFVFLINILFGLAVGACNAYLLLNKEVSKTLR